MPVEMVAIYRSLYPDIHTDRQRQNRYDAIRAIEILGLLPNPIPPATWLVDWKGANKGKQGAVKWSILEQLGRMARQGYDNDTIRALAAEIGKLQLSAKDAAEQLRQMRTAKPRP
jgi:hypothetical protein